jgi:hypothetical protein
MLALTSVAAAEDRGPEINPYECLGRYESATGNRTMPQVRKELNKRMSPLFEPGEPPTVKAMKACVIAMLKSRLGDSDAGDYYAMAVANDPEEPGYEFWYGRYYSGFRGARGPVVENAEDHFYAALEKLKAKKAAGKYREYHAVVEEWTRKQLMVIYQEDGLHFLPWAKAYPQHGKAGRDLPSLSLSAQMHVSKDTRDFYRNNEMRLFTGELMFANSSYRTLGVFNATQQYNLARAPLRYRGEARLRLRQNLLGAFDASFSYEKMKEGQVLSYYLVPGMDPSIPGSEKARFTDVNVREAYFGYERVFPLYPLMDLKLKGGAKYIDRQGVVEFLEYAHEKFWGADVRPSVSHFVGPDKVMLDLVWVYMNVSDVPYGVQADAGRAKYIRAANLEYAIYRPFLMPEFRGGALGLHRKPTRGWYWNLGAANDQDVYGTKTVDRKDFYLGTRFEGAGNWDVSVQGTYSTSDVDALNFATGVVEDDPGAPMKSTSFRTSAIIQRRLINPDAIPGISGSFIAPDMVNLVVPVSWDKGLSGSDCHGQFNAPWDARYVASADCYKLYENVRVGAEIWTKFFGTGFGGPSFLTTVGYDYQYFYQIKKAFHEVHLNLRMGWDWHKL